MKVVYEYMYLKNQALLNCAIEHLELLEQGVFVEVEQQFFFFFTLTSGNHERYLSFVLAFCIVGRFAV